MYTGKREEHIFLGREIAQQKDYSEETAIEIDSEIKRIVLEVLKDTGEYRRGQILTFTDAVIIIREKVDKKGQWSVMDVSGIPVP